MLKITRDKVTQHLDLALKAEMPDLLVILDNEAYDANNLPDFHVNVEINFDGGWQANIGVSPRTRTHGEVVVSAARRLGTGSRDSLGALDWFSSKLKYVNLDGVQFQAPVAMAPSRGEEWYSNRIAIPFQFTD